MVVPAKIGIVYFKCIYLYVKRKIYFVCLDQKLNFYLKYTSKIMNDPTVPIHYKSNQLARYDESKNFVTAAVVSPTENQTETVRESA